MAVFSELRTLLERSDARAIAFDPQGGSSVPLPAEFANLAAGTLAGKSPLDQIEAESQGRAVVAFERARRRGHGAASITINGESEASWLEIFDLGETHGCFIAVATPQSAAPIDQLGAATLAPRQSTYDLNATGVIQSVGPEFTNMFGWEAAEVIGRSSLDFVHEDDHEVGIINWIEMLEAPSRQVRMRQRMKTAAGLWIWCELTETNLLDQPGVGCVRSEIVDVSREMEAQAALQQREQLLDRLTRALPTGVMQLDAGGTVAVQNQRWSELIGDPDGDGLAALITRLVDPAPVERAVDHALSEGSDADLSVTLDGKGDCHFGELHIRPLQEGGAISGLLLTLDDVTKLQTYQMELTEQARRDSLTGAYNRLGIEELIRNHLKMHNGSSDELRVLFIDLDQFKKINDDLGHMIGDQVLRSVADKIAGLLRSDDHLGRLGGDEFLVIFEPGTSEAGAASLAARIEIALPKLSESFDEPVEIGASVGLATADVGDDFDSFIRRADAAMYEAKRLREHQVTR